MNGTAIEIETENDGDSRRAAAETTRQEATASGTGNAIGSGSASASRACGRDCWSDSWNGCANETRTGVSENGNGPGGPWTSSESGCGFARESESENDWRKENKEKNRAKLND